MLSGIQLLRGVAAMLVVLSHANIMTGYPQYYSQNPFAFHEAGTFGVAMFFVISGFIIMLDATGGAISA